MSQRVREVEAFLAWARDRGVGATWLMNRSTAAVLAERVDMLLAEREARTQALEKALPVIRAGLSVNHFALSDDESARVIAAERALEALAAAEEPQ